MRRISLIPYRVNGDIAYDVRGSLVNALFSMKLGTKDLVEHDRIAKKIETTETNEVILTDEEYSKLRWCIEILPQGYTRNDLEFVTRVLDAEEISDQETGGKNQNV